MSIAETNGCYDLDVRSRKAGSVASAGYFVVSTNYLSFWTKCFKVTDEKMRIPLSQVVGAKPVFRYRFGAYGIEMTFKQRKPISFDFSSEEVRNDVVSRVTEAVRKIRKTKTSPAVHSPLLRSGSDMAARGFTDSPRPLTPSTSSSTSLASTASVPTPSSRSFSGSGFTATTLLSSIEQTIENAKHCTVEEELLDLPKVINLPSGVTAGMKERHFVCLTIGSRGDVQPYIALGKGLQKRGHRVTIVTHDEYKEWVEGFGIEHRTAGGDPGALMKLSVEHKMFSPQFFKESLTNVSYHDWSKKFSNWTDLILCLWQFRSWLDAREFLIIGDLLPL